MSAPPKLSPEITKELKKIFYSEEFAIAGLDRLWQEVKRRKIDISHRELKKGFYELQEVVQIFAPEKKVVKHKAHAISATYPGERVYFDTMFFPRNKLFVINAFDLASKYAWGHAYKVKTRLDDTKTSVTAKKATQFLKEVLDDMNNRGYFIANLYTDTGSEWLSTFQKELAEHGITHRFTTPGDHLQTAPIDRYTKTLRTMAEKWHAVHGGDLYNDIPKLIKAYNNHVHSKIGVLPSEALASIGTSKQVVVEDDYEKRDVSIKAGDTVRVYVRENKNPRKKIRQNWSKDLYKVKSVNSGTGECTLTNGKKFRDHLLLVVPHPELIQKVVQVLDVQSRKVAAPRTAKSGQPSATSPPPMRPKRQVRARREADFEYDLEAL